MTYGFPLTAGNPCDTGDGGLISVLLHRVHGLPVSYEWCTRCSNLGPLGMVSSMLVWYGSEILYLVCFFFFFLTLLCFLVLYTIAFSLFHFLGGTGWQKQ